MTVKYEELVVIKKSDLDKIINELEVLKPNNGDTRLLRVAVLSNLQQLNTKPLIPFLENSWDKGFVQGENYAQIGAEITYFDINKEIEF